ncbi:PP1R7 phosphatase, partial [Atractosteus spatula]|nr:PP1R7 phosphatase [Atractosteus spatula]
MLYTLAGGGTLCGVAALVLLIVSTATDFWMQYRYSGSAANQGLWRFCINRKCHSHTISVESCPYVCQFSSLLTVMQELLWEIYSFWDATRAFMLLAVLSCFAGIVLGLSAFTNGAKSRRIRIGGIALLLSAFLALLALSIYTGVTVHFFGKRYLEWRFSWSYILGWVAILLAFAAVDRRGESEESGDDEGKKKGLNGESEPQQPALPEKEEESPVDMDTITLDPEEEDVDLVHCRIGKIEGLEILKKAKTISLRQNLIKQIENLESLSGLRELDLYDNQIHKLENLQALTEMEVLDVSFNVLRKIEGLERLTRLRKLFLLHNKISRIDNVGHLSNLEMLELGSNRIRVIENLDALSQLDSLFLGTNKITRLQNLDGLHNLTVLSIQSNRITKMEGLQSLVNLRELYLSHNGIEVIEGLENNKKLTTLDVAANRIKKIENISHLTELQEFWMNDNQIENWGDLDELKNARGLETVYLERNPLQKDPQYRRKIMLALPSVRQIDATFIRF